MPLTDQTLPPAAYLDDRSMRAAGSHHLIKRPLSHDVPKFSRLKDDDLERMVLESFAKSAHPDCLRCPHAKMKKKKDWLNDTTRYTVFCTVDKCNKAGWTIYGPMTKRPKTINGRRADKVCINEIASIPYGQQIPDPQDDGDDEVLSLDDVLDATDQVLTPGAGSW